MDCGGECAPCLAAGTPCNSPYDCASKICSFTDPIPSLASAVAVSTVPGGGGRCVANSTADHLKNGDEADVDCGAALCSAYGKAAECPGICMAGMQCSVSEDCRNLVCNTQDQEYDRAKVNLQFCMSPPLSSSNPDIAARIRSGVTLPKATKRSLHNPTDQTLVVVRDIDRLLSSVGLLVDVPRTQFVVDVVVENMRPLETGPGSFFDVRMCRGGGFQRGPYNDTRDGWAKQWATAAPFVPPRATLQPARVVRQEGLAASRNAQGGWEPQRGVFDLTVADSPGGVPPAPCTDAAPGAPFTPFNFSANDLVLSTRVRWVAYVSQYEVLLLLERMKRLLDLRLLPGGWEVERAVLRELDWVTQDAEYCFWHGRNYTHQAFNMSGVDCSLYLNCSSGGTWPGTPDLLPLWRAPDVVPVLFLSHGTTLTSRFDYDSSRNLTELTQCFNNDAPQRPFPALYTAAESVVPDSDQRRRARALQAGGRGAAAAATAPAAPPFVDPVLAALCAAAVPSALNFNAIDTCAAPVDCSSALYTCIGAQTSCSAGGWSNAFSCSGGCSSPGACPTSCAVSPLAPVSGPPFTHVVVVNDQVLAGAGGAVNRTQCAFPLLSSATLSDDNLCRAFAAQNTRVNPNSTRDAYGVPSLACEYRLNCTTVTLPLSSALVALPPVPPLRLASPGVAAIVRAWANFSSGAAPTVMRSTCYYPTTPPFAATLSPFLQNDVWVRSPYVRNRLRDWVRARCFPLWGAADPAAARAADPVAAFRCNSRMGRGNSRTSSDDNVAPANTTFDSGILTEVPRVGLRELLEDAGLQYDNATGPQYLPPGATMDVSTCGDITQNCNRGENALPTNVFTPAAVNVVVEPRGTPAAPLFRDQPVPIPPVVELVDRHGRHVSKWDGDLTVTLFIDRNIFPQTWFVDGTPSPSNSPLPYGANSYYEEPSVQQLQLYPEGMYYQLVPKALQVFGATSLKLAPDGFAIFRDIVFTRAVKGLFLNFSVKYKLQTLKGATRPFDVLVPYPTPLVLITRYILPPGAVVFFIAFSIFAVFAAAKWGITRLRRARLPVLTDGSRDRPVPDLEGARAMKSSGGAVLFTPDFAKAMFAPFRYVAGMLPAAIRAAALNMGRRNASSYNPDTHPDPAWVAEQMERKANARLVPQLTVDGGLRPVGPSTLRAFDTALGRAKALGGGGGGASAAAQASQPQIQTALGPLLLAREPAEIEAERAAAVAAAARVEAAARAAEAERKLSLTIRGMKLSVPLPVALQTARKSMLAKLGGGGAGAGAAAGGAPPPLEPALKARRKPLKETLNDIFLQLHARFMPPLPGLDTVHKLPIPARPLVVHDVDNSDAAAQTEKHLADWEAQARARAQGLQKSVTAASTRTRGAVKGSGVQVQVREEVVEPEPGDFKAPKLGGGAPPSSRTLSGASSRALGETERGSTAPASRNPEPGKPSGAVSPALPGQVTPRQK